MSRLSRAIAIRPGEGRLVVLVAGAFSAVEAGRGLGEVGVDALVISQLGADRFPVLYIGLGLTGLVVTLTYGAALTRSTSQRFFPALLLVLAAVLGIEWLVTLTRLEAIVPIVWISVYAAGLLMLTAIWTVGGFTFDARQAKRLFPLLTSAAIVGSLSGFLAAIVVERIVGAEALILGEAVLFVVAAALLSGLGARVRPRRARGETTPPLITALTAGAAYVARSPLMRLVALAYVLLAILLFSLTFPFMRALEAEVPEEDVLTVLALFSSAVTIVSFLAGTLLANRLFARFGVATVALALPAMYLLGFGIWMARFNLVTAVIVRFAQQVTQRGVSNAAWSAFYNVIPSRRRGQVLAFMDGVPGQLGTILSGVLLIIAASLATNEQQVVLMGFVAAAICLGVGILIRRAYASSLVATLREGRAEQVLEGGPGLASLGRDARVVEGLRRATSSGRPQERLLAADLLGRIGSPEALPELRRLADDDDAGVRSAALSALVELEGHEAVARLEHALDDADPGVRVTAVAGLGRLGAIADIDAARLDGRLADGSPLVRRELAVAFGTTGDAARAQAIVDELMASEVAADRAAGLDACARIGSGIDAATALEMVEDPSPEVRAAALRATAAHGLGGQAIYLAAFDDPSREVRATASAIVRTWDAPAEALVTMLRNGSERAQEAALEALEGHADAVRDELLAWADEQVERALGLRSHAAVLTSGVQTSSAAFLAQVVARREGAIEARLLLALAVLGAPEAGGLIRRCLHAPDPEVRAQAIEALDALGDARVARGVVRLLDRDGSDAVSSADVIAAATTLSHDRDPWVRALALRTLAEHLRSSQRALLRQVRDDPVALVRAAVAVEEGEAVMPESIQLVSDVDRMLALRRVPLFEALGPEDLQRVAASATEQRWGEGDELVTEGELGDEMVVIVEGRVRVVHRDGEAEHLLRHFGEGDHIGELAVLREAPRAATVIAEPGGVHGLVISGEAIQALLRERPEAAMAMLATLAERISQQG